MKKCYNKECEFSDTMSESGCRSGYIKHMELCMDRVEAVETKIINQGPFKTQVGGSHYRDNFPFCQPSEFFARNKIPFIPANVCKYVLRHAQKGGIEDLKKAKHYLEMIAWAEYGEEL